MDQFHAAGIIPIPARVVEDRNRITGAGVTSGLDFGLTVVARIRGAQHVKRNQLAIEYDPQPPFNAGSPQSAGPTLTAEVRAQLGANVASHVAAAVEANEQRSTCSPLAVVITRSRGIHTPETT